MIHEKKTLKLNTISQVNWQDEGVEFSVFFVLFYFIINAWCVFKY